MFISADLASTYATSIADATTSEATVDLTGGSYVTISASDVVISLTPDSSSSSSTAYAKTTVTLESSSTNSIQLYLSMSGTTTSLYKDGDTSSSSPTIDATTTPGSLDDFEDNTWGYSLDNTTYRSVPVAGSASSDNLVIELDNSSSGSNSNSDESSTITQDIYYGIKVSSSLASGTYSNSVTYTATVNSAAVSFTAELTKIEVDDTEVSSLLIGLENTITVTTNIKTDIHGEPRAYYEITDENDNVSRQECDTVKVGEDEDGYLTVTCTVTPTTEATSATLIITAKDSEDDYYCTNGIYNADSSDCEAGNWKWGTFEIELPEIKEGSSNAFGITYMQEMTTDICAAAEVDTTAQLIDIRDNKIYWVAKLADGNCWMTQNLDYDLGNNSSGSSVTLYSDTSNITSGDSTTFTAYFYTSAADGTTDRSRVQTWDLGEYVIINPTNTSSSAYCGGFGVYTLDNSNCTSYFTDVSKLTARDYITDYTDGSTATVDDTSYDAHYLVGNHYSWNAATASTSSSYGTATNSICPTNWTLPLSNSTDSGSFSYLLHAYGLLSSLSSSTGSVSSGNYNIASDPLYFVRGGNANDTINYLYLTHAGYYGHYWSRVAYSSSLAYSLTFSSSVDPSDYHYRYRNDGFSVRCVVVP